MLLFAQMMLGFRLILHVLLTFLNHQIVLYAPHKAECLYLPCVMLMVSCIKTFLVHLLPLQWNLSWMTPSEKNTLTGKTFSNLWKKLFTIEFHANWICLKSQLYRDFKGVCSRQVSMYVPFLLSAARSAVIYRCLNFQDGFIMHLFIKTHVL